MAGTTAESVEQINKVSLRVMVDKENHKVVYAEAGKDFVDALFSFLTLPLGTIARLVSKESNIEAVKFGSISSLYQSVSELDEQYLSSHTCKEMLLNPRNSMEAYCQKLKLNIDDTEPLQHFVCEFWHCSRNGSDNRLSLFRNQKCSCGKVMNKVLSPPKFESLENGFAKETATFIVSDNLFVMPNVFGTVVHLLHKLKITTFEAIVEQTVEISKKEVVDILKLSLVSKTPLTDFIFKKKHIDDGFHKINQSELKNGEVTSEEARQIPVKVVRRKSTGEILFAEGDQDFADIIFSFLTFPLGKVLHILEGFSSISCIDNLYKSVTDLSSDRYLLSEGLVDLLTKPLIAAQFELSNQILPIGVASLPLYYCHTYILGHEHHRSISTEPNYLGYRTYYSNENCVPLNLVDPKSSASKSSSCGEFVIGPLTYMVTDDLVVTPMSSSTAISYLNGSKVSLFDVEEKVVRIGLNEGLSILKASLVSTFALTYGLNQFISTIKEDK